MSLNLDLCIEELYKGEILNELTIKELCERLKETLVYQSNVQSIELPVTIVGNIHGYATNSVIICTTFSYPSLSSKPIL